MRDGYRNDCKACNLAEKQRRYLANPEVVKARVKRWQQQNSERLNAYWRKRRLEPEVKKAQRAGHLKRKFGLTLEQYDAMLAKQGGCCALCRRPPRTIALHVDHDHATGAIRGLLCFQCNNALADLQEDPRLLAKAMTYLFAHDRSVQEEVALARERARRLGQPPWAAATAAAAAP